MYELTEKLIKLMPYDPIQGDYKIRLDANESFVNTSAEDLKKAVAGTNVNRYPDPYAKKLIGAYSDFYGINPDLVTAGNGSDEIISIITACFLKKGEKVLTLAPDFSMYSFYSSLYELDVRVMKKQSDLSIDVDKVIETVNKEGIRAVLFSNPCNPTSLGMEKTDVIKLINSVKALVILDEAYMDFWKGLEDQSLIKDTAGYDNLIVLRTCSKALGMAGLRLGFAVSNVTITEKLRAAKSPYNVNALTQQAAEYFLSDKKEMERRIKACIDALNELDNGLCEMNLPFFERIYPSVTNFLFIKTSKAREIFEYLLSQSIAVRYMGDYLRITAGSTEENKAVITALLKFPNQ
ncbi:MAG: aminotransferase class I/II-fold pyridoxal phosphate-dependent enzyme [Firmicutes bacterium]|nr:aminotransferase class I/II-fold pyridoxal phosphate-dependent enzyme [[Eubacterium] siraeum]MCM1488071.1 aminotransferase class I/II-fold pyridoxal phosphate-dependent enzyme [Bacillota bacterium]